MAIKNTLNCYDSRGAGPMQSYLLYDWHGKLKWVYLLGVYLVDPLYENVFLKGQKKAVINGPPCKS